MITTLPVGFNTYLRFLIVSSAGVGVTGQTPVVAIKRRVDSMYWNGTTFQSGYVTNAMVEEDDINLPGSYFYNFNQSSAGGSQAEYLVRYLNAGSPVALDEEQFIYSVQSTSLNPDVQVRYSMSDDGVTLSIAAWVEVGGQRVTNYISLTAVIDDALGNLIVSLGTQSVQ